MTDLLKILSLGTVDEDLFRAGFVFAEDRSLYGGQVAAQALLAAGRTVAGSRQPHSLHGYFLRKGDSRVPTDFRVHRDRDGRSISARRVVAAQRGEVIFTLSASFQVPLDGPESQAATMPQTCPPEAGTPDGLIRLHSFDGRLPEQPYDSPWPTLFWARAAVDLPEDPLLHACALTYLSDISTGVVPEPDRSVLPSASIDHSVWFHRAVDMNGWTLTEHRPRVTGHGRGWYTGSVFVPDGTLVASIAQECLYR